MGWPAVLAAALVLSGAGGIAAQEAPTQVTVDLGTADGPPGTTVFIPIIVIVPDGTAVTAIEQEINFESWALSFVRAEVAPQGAAAGVDLKTSEERDPADDNRSILRVTVTAERPLETGAVADLVFRIDEDGADPPPGTGHKPGMVITALKNQARARVGGELSAVTGRDGEVQITEGVLIFGCFFYMH